MSYHIVKSIKIKDDGVYIKGSDNNVWPKSYNEWKCTYYDEMIKEGNKEKIELDILEAYISGTFQSGTKNKYTKALQILCHSLKFKKFDWQEDWDNYGTNQEKYKDEYISLLKNALKNPLPKDKFVITKTEYDKTVYGKVSKRMIRWYYEIEKATKYSWKEDAEFIKKYFTNSENWKVIQL